MLSPLALLGFFVAGIATSHDGSEISSRLAVPPRTTFVGSALVAIVLGLLLRSRARSSLNQADTQIASGALAVGWISASLGFVVGASTI